MTYAADNRLESNARDCRWSARMSQLQVAHEAGVALETVRKLEYGEAVGMKIETILRVASVLGVAPADLLPILGSPPRESDLPARRRRVVSPAWKRRDVLTGS